MLCQPLASGNRLACSAWVVSSRVLARRPVPCVPSVSMQGRSSWGRDDEVLQAKPAGARSSVFAQSVRHSSAAAALAGSVVSTPPRWRVQAEAWRRKNERETRRETRQCQQCCHLRGHGELARLSTQRLYKRHRIVRRERNNDLAALLGRQCGREPSKESP